MMLRLHGSSHRPGGRSATHVGQSTPVIGQMGRGQQALIISVAVRINVRNGSSLQGQGDGKWRLPN